MRYYADTDNNFRIQGHVARLNSYANGKAMNVIIGVKTGKNKKDMFIGTKCFDEKIFGNLTVGMPIIIFGHIGEMCYTDKNGETHYKDNNDLIADVIIYNEKVDDTNIRRIEHEN